MIGFACAILVPLLAYVMLTANLTSLNYALARATHDKHRAGRRDAAARRSHRAADVARAAGRRSPAALKMHDPHVYAVVRVPEPKPAQPRPTGIAFLGSWLSGRVRTSAGCWFRSARHRLMAARAFARVAPVRAKVALVVFVVLALRARRCGSATCRSTRARGSRAPRWPSTTRRSSRSRGAARSSIATAGCWCARCRRSRSTPCPPEVTDPHASPPKLAPLLHKPPAALEAALRDKPRVPLAGAQGAARRRRARARARTSTGSDSSPKRPGMRFVAVGPARVDRGRLHRHRRERPRRPGVPLRPAAARQARHDADRGRPVRPRDPVRRDPGRRARRSRAHASSPRSTRTCNSKPSGCCAPACSKWHARSGTAIVMDPWTGEMLALANVPDFDPARYGAFAPRRVAQSRDHRCVRAGFDVQADHRRGGARERHKSRRARAFRRATRSRSAAARSTTPRTA